VEETEGRVVELLEELRRTAQADGEQPPG
jgi:hypothetical protein